MKKTLLTTVFTIMSLIFSVGAWGATTDLVLAFTGSTTYMNPLVVTDDNGTHTLQITSTFTTVQGSTVEMGANEGNMTFTIDATSGKFAYNGQPSAQINAGTKIKFTVEGNATVSFKNTYQSGTTTISLYVDGEEDAVDSQEMTAGGVYELSYTSPYKRFRIAFTETSQIYCSNIKVTDAKGTYNFLFDFAENTNLASGTREIASTEDSSNKMTLTAGNGSFRYQSNYGFQISQNNYVEFDAAGDVDAVVTISYAGDANGILVLSSDGTEITTAAVAKGGSKTEYTLSYATPKAEAYVPSTWDGKAEVWDFGQAVIEGAHNYITAEAINDWYKKEDGSYADASGSKTYADAENLATNIANASGWTLPSFTTGDLSFNAGGKTNHRFRTSKTNVIRYDSKSYSGGYNGYIYSNAGSTSTVYVALANCKKGDKIDYVLGTNGNPGTFEFANETEVVADGSISTIPTELSFYVPEDGTYRIYCTNEKLTVARITRTHAGNAKVTGSVSALTANNEAITGDDLKTVFAATKLVFSNDDIKFSKEVEIAADGTFSAVNIPSGFTYAITPSATDYIVASGNTIDIPATQEGNVDVEISAHNVTLKAIDKVSVSGTITGLENTSKLSIVAYTSELYTPEFTITGNTYTAMLQKGIEYTLIAEGVNDYELLTSTVQESADNDALNLEFNKKATYAITIVPTGATAEELESAKFIFTRVDDKYSYSFIGTTGIELRNGTYQVKVNNRGKYAQLLTSNLTVSGAATSKTIDFDGNVREWNFAASDFDNALSYNGLTSTNGQKNKTYLLSNTGTVTIPVQKGDIVTIRGCYQMAFQFESEEAVATKSGSTSNIETYTYVYSGDAETATITVSGSTYFTYISAVSTVEFASTLHVGATRDYKTVSEALAAVEKMDREAGEAGRVTIMIDPGNYEEMPVINSDYITLKNSASAPSIALTNKGVDIDENAVRITSYYGEGYNYYSCGTDNKWNERVLAVSKENNQISNTCYGGSTNESYWNATVVVYGKEFIAEDIIFENSFNQYISAKEANDVVINKKGNNPSGTKVDNGIMRPTTVGSTAVQDKKYVERAAAIAIIGDRAVLNHCAVVGRQDSFYGHTKVRVACYQCELYGATDYIFGSQDMIVYDSKLVMNTSDDKNDQAYLIALKAPSYKGSLFLNCDIVSTVPGENTASTYKSKPGYLGRPWEKAEYAVFANINVEKSNYAANELNYDGKSLLVSNPWNSGLGGVAVNSFEYNINVNGAARISGGYEGISLTDSEAEEITLYTFTKGNDEWDPFAVLFGIDSSKSAYTIATPIEEVIADDIKGDREVAAVEYYTIDGVKANESHIGMVIKVVRYTDGSKEAFKMMRR